MIKSYSKKILINLTGPALLILAWDGIFRFGGYEKSLFPSPSDVAGAFREITVSGFLLESIMVSLLRFAIGYLTAVSAGITLGLLLGRIPIALQLLNPIIQICRPVSPIAWFPFIVLFFGIGNLPAVVIIFIAAFFPVLLSTVSGVKKIDPQILKVARNFGIRQPWMLLKIIFPAAFPTITIGLHLALGAAWVFLVAGEMVGAQSGLGYLIIDGRNNLRIDIVLAGIIAIGVIGLILDRLIFLFERWVGTHWGTHATGDTVS